MDKKKDIKIIRIRAELVFLVTLLLVFGCTFLVNQNQQRREKLKAAYTAESTISRIEVQLNRYLVESNLVKKSIEEGLTISDKQFATLSRLMQDEEDIIKVHEIAKDGIVSQIYPMEGNEDVIGLNMIENPERKRGIRQRSIPLILCGKKVRRDTYYIGMDKSRKNDGVKHCEGKVLLIFFSWTC